MVDETYPTKGNLSTADASHALFNGCFRNVRFFSGSPFVFRVGPSCGIKRSCGLVDYASSIHAIG